jgi:hypothetical protein
MAQLDDSMLMTKSSDRPTNFVPTRLTITMAMMSAIPIAWADQSGVSHGSNARIRLASESKGSGGHPDA